MNIWILRRKINQKGNFRVEIVSSWQSEMEKKIHIVYRSNNNIVGVFFSLKPLFFSDEIMQIKTTN